MREGDLDHLIFYALQSTHFTKLPPIEPALSAKALVQALDPAERDGFLRGQAAREPSVPAAVRARVAAFVEALDSSSRDPRLAYFRALVQTTFPDRRGREAALHREYLRAMRFIYQKEFVAQPAGAAAVAELYRARGLSTDTAVEAGYVVYTGLGIIRALEPERRIRRVLIVGPGLDLAPRTGLVEAASARKLPALGRHRRAALARPVTRRRTAGRGGRHQPAGRRPSQPGRASVRRC